MPQSQSKLENEVDKLLDRIFTVDMLMHPEKMDEQEMGEIKIDRSAEYKADQFLDWADRSRCLIMHYKILKADELKKRGADQAKTRSELRKMEGEIKEKLDAMSKWLKKQTKGRKKSKFSVDELKNRNLTWKLLSKKLKSLSMPTDDVDAPRANVSEFLSEGGGGGGGASAGGEDFEASNSEEEEEMTMDHREALLKAKAEEEKQDVILRLIEAELLQIKDHASTIGDALEDQEKMYEKAHSKVQEMNQKMEDVNVKLEATNQDAEKDHPELICVCICCVGVLLGLAIVAYKLLVQYMEAKNSNSNNNNRLMM